MCTILETNRSSVQEFSQETTITAHVDVTTSGRVDFNTVDGMFQFHFTNRGERFEVVSYNCTPIATTIQNFFVAATY